MNPTNPNIEGVNPGELKLDEVRKHPFGIVVVYLQFGVGIVIALGLLLFLLPGILPQDVLGTYSFIVSLISVAILGLVFLVMLVATYIYRLNRFVITDQHITQVAQHGLFNRKVSELSLANVEDVSAEKRGIFATIFNYGTLKIETAGEQNNFHFTYCPNPDYYGKRILDARQSFIANNGATGRSNERFAIRR